MDKILGLLKENPHLVNHKDKCGYTALLDACADGSVEVVEMLIKHGADVNIFNEKEIVTPLMDVCHAGHVNLIEVILQAGAEVSMRDRKGWSAADYLEDAIRKKTVDRIEATYNKNYIP